MKAWPVLLGALGVALGIAAGVALGGRSRPAPSAAPRPSARTEAIIVRRAIERDTLRVDLFLPAPAPGALPAPAASSELTARPPSAEAPTPWVVLAHERGWPAPDERERSSAAIADALGERGIGVAQLSYVVSEATPLARCAEHVAEAVRELTGRASEYGLAAQPFLVGDEASASLVASLALEPRYRLSTNALAGVVVMSGDFEPTLTGLARPDAPPFLILSAHDESKRSAESSRALARALERAGAQDVRGHHVSTRDARSLSNLSGERNDVAELVTAFVRRAPTPGGADGAWSLDETWGRVPPLSSEPFWADARLVVRRPTDARLRAQVRALFGEMIRDLEPWPALTYDAIDLGAYLDAHPELGTGRWVEATNARGERLVLRRDEIEQRKVAIVIGIDDERNLFRLYATYNVYRTYSWKPETEARPLLVRSVGAFLHVPSEPARGREGGDATPGLPVATLADFALTPTSFRVTSADPLARARALPKALAAVLTNEQGCLQCHALHGEGGRAHHVRARDGKLAEAYGLPLEEYPREVLQRFLFEQDAVAKSFGVGPLHVDAAAAKQLLAEIAR